MKKIVFVLFALMILGSVDVFAVKKQGNTYILEDKDKLDPKYKTAADSGTALDKLNALIGDTLKAGDSIIFSEGSSLRLKDTSLYIPFNVHIVFECKSKFKLGAWKTGEALPKYHRTIGLTAGSSLTFDTTCSWKDGLKEWKMCYHGDRNQKVTIGGSTLVVASCDSSAGCSGYDFFSGGGTNYYNSSCVPPVPVKLLTFYGLINDLNQAELHWSTAQEINNERFEIYRSIGDFGEYELIGSVAGNGNSMEIRSFSFIDQEYSNQTTYYKLRQVDFDGQSEEFEAIVISSKNQMNFVAYPNPGTEELHIKHQRNPIGELKIVVTNIDGNVVYNTTTMDSDHQIDISGFRSGIYFIEVTDFMSSSKQRFIRL
ncbi:MAG: T9SS type A sorting domain-containing protein [Bacteroidia bacterium]